MEYRWFTYGVKDEMAKWSFMSEEQILAKVSLLSGVNCFYTIQSYNSDMTKKRCPLFFDFDGASAGADATALVAQIHGEFGVYPDIYDSGNKGYHVVLPIIIVDENCERIVKYIADNLFVIGSSWDTSIYSSRRMWRIPDTYNVGGDRNKKQLNKKFIFNKDDLKVDRLKEWVEKARLAVKETQSAYDDYISVDSRWKENITPCVYRMIKEDHSKGDRHNIIFFLARFFKYYNTEAEEGIQILLKQEWARPYENHIRTTFTSCYKSAYPARFGCKNDLAQSFCVSELCIFKRGDE